MAAQDCYGIAYDVQGDRVIFLGGQYFGYYLDQLSTFSLRTLVRYINRMNAGASEEPVLLRRLTSELSRRTAASFEEKGAQEFDVLTLHAAEDYGVIPSAVTPQMRATAKVKHFGELYGSAPFPQHNHTCATGRTRRMVDRVDFGKLELRVLRPETTEEDDHD